MSESRVLIDLENEDAIPEVMGRLEHLEHLEQDSGIDLRGAAAAVRRAESGQLEFWRSDAHPGRLEGALGGRARVARRHCDS